VEQDSMHLPHWLQSASTLVILRSIIESAILGQFKTQSPHKIQRFCQ
jgi:hypothetical protein